MNRVNVFAIHRCINEGYGLIRIFTEKIRISPTKLWRVWIMVVAVINPTIVRYFIVRYFMTELKNMVMVVTL